MKVTNFELDNKSYKIPVKEFEPESEAELAVIGVHGFAGDKESSVLKRLGEALCERSGALVCFDFPAHGTSSADDSMLRVENCKNDLMTVVDYVKSKYKNAKYAVFATSFGGYITLQCSDMLDDFKLLLRAPAVTMADAFINKIIPVSLDEFREKRQALCGFERLMYVPYDFYDDLATRAVPTPKNETMIIHGTLDDLIEYDAVKKFAESAENIKLISVEGADHRFKRKGDLDAIIDNAILWLF